MKAQEMIEVLQQIVAIYGDLPVVGVMNDLGEVPTLVVGTNNGRPTEVLIVDSAMLDYYRDTDLTSNEILH